MKLRPSPPKLFLVMAASVLLALGASGCGSSVDPALVKSAGEHGDVLQDNYDLMAENELAKLKSSSLDIFDKADDPKSVSSSDLSKAENSAEKQLDRLKKFRRELTAANVKLRKTPLPDFEEYLDPTAEVKSFSKNYSQTTSITRRVGTVLLGVTSLAISAYDELVVFFDKWRDYIAGGNAATFVAAGTKSGDALTRMGKQMDRLGAKASIVNQLEGNVSDMAKAATDDSQLSDLITKLGEEYPNSFLPKHIVEKK